MKLQDSYVFMGGVVSFKITRLLYVNVRRVVQEVTDRGDGGEAISRSLSLTHTMTMAISICTCGLIMRN